MSATHRRDWTPRVPVRLYLIEGDEQVVNSNTFRCRAALPARGVKPSVVKVGPLKFQGSKHLGSNVTAAAATVRWFNRLP
ncbi:hypothetical protein [Sphaerisporangium flaviroseum]|uniref:hypothetical protein n=1 Tax=Sphaerisporangium flaviroseum TaxID=509199 RepID=UPI0031E6A66A